MTHGDHEFAANFVTLNGDGESGEVKNNWLDGEIASCAAMSTARTGTAAYNNEGNDGKLPDVWAAPATSVPTDGSGAALSFVGPLCRYVKHKGRVTGSAYVLYPATADGTAALLDLELPTALNSLSVRGGVSIGATNCADAVQALLLGNTTGHVQFFSAADLTTRTTNAQLSGKTLYISFDYEAA